MTEAEFKIEKKPTDYAIYLDEYQEYEQRLDSWVYDALQDAEVSE